LETDAIDDQFDGVRDDLFEILRKQRLMPNCVDVAIDLHEWRFYGDAGTDHVLITYPDQGTNRTYCFATICIVAPGTRFTLDVLALEANGFRTKREAVRSLLETAHEYVSIRHVYLDRGFYQVHVVAEFEQFDVDYIIRARPSKGMKARLSASAETVVDEYLMQRKRDPTASVAVTVFAVPHRTTEDEHVWFITNLELEPEAAKAYAAAFRRRWGSKPPIARSETFSRERRRAFDVPDGDAVFEEAASKHMPDDKSRVWNNAIMELGGVACEQTPRCDEAGCPWREWCGAYASGDFTAPDVPTQPSFEGSRRQFRGRVIATLREYDELDVDSSVTASASTTPRRRVRTGVARGDSNRSRVGRTGRVRLRRRHSYRTASAVERASREE